MPETAGVRRKAGPVSAQVFASLRNLLVPYARGLSVTRDSPTNYHLETASPSYKGKPLFFAAVQIKKSYVSFHLMPVYVYPELKKTMTPELRKRMQGKSCFNFKTLEGAPLAELAALVKAGFMAYRKDKLL